jgi:hypothetical protein
MAVKVSFLRIVSVGTIFATGVILACHPVVLIVYTGQREARKPATAKSHV